MMSVVTDKIKLKCQEYSKGILANNYIKLVAISSRSFLHLAISHKL